MRTLHKSLAALSALAIILGLVFNSYLRVEWGRSEVFADDAVPEATPAFEYSFDGSSVLKEASSSKNSTSKDWWLRSGGSFKNSNGVGRTLIGNLPTTDYYRLSYAEKAPVASDNGYHPQNIFRLLSKRTWGDIEQGVYFKIINENIFNPENSHEWNGVSLLSRYQNEDNYYYAGLRMDGSAVIKKKKGGVYSTLALEKVYSGTYSSSVNPNLIPKNSKIGLKMKTYNSAAGVVVKLYVDKSGNGNWTLAAEAVDKTNSLTKAGTTGIYTDYMDLEFSNYAIYTLKAVADAPDTPVTPAPDEDSASDTTDPDEVATPADDTPESDQGGNDPDSKDDTASSEPEPSKETPEQNNDDDSKPGTIGDVVGGLLSYGLSLSGSIQEAGSMSESSNGDWWVNSGGYFTIANSIGKTVIGKLPENDKWRKLYASANPTDTDNGYHPQNIFRLVSKKTYKNFVQQGYFKIDEYNTSSSPNRAEHNGILFFNRYENGMNLYYTGIRVDGNAVIKKKIGGTYYTLALKPVYSGTYNRSSNPNLIPTGAWIGMRSEVKDNADGSVSIKFYVDKSGNGNWTLAAEATDTGKQGAKISSKSSVGIRTDFMDVEVKGYLMKEL